MRRIMLSTWFATLLFLTGSASPTRAGVHIWTGGNPRGKGIEAITVDPITPTRMWAASFGAGVLRSLDGGATWTANRTGLVNTFVRALAVQPLHPDSVYCATNDGVFLSVDGGVNWNKLLSTNSSVRAIVVNPIRTGVVYASTFGSGIYKSINGGKNWSTVNPGLANTAVRDIAMDPAKPETLFAATGTGGGIHRSVNGGLTWVQSSDPSANGFAIEKIRFDLLDPNLMYAATVDAGALKSPDRGVTWVRVNRGLTNFRTRSIAIVDTLRYVGTDGSGVFITSLNDTLWHPVSNGLSNLVVDVLFPQPSVPGKLWAGTDGGGMLTTVNRGANWSQVDGGSLDTHAFSLLFNPSNGHLYDGGGFGDQFWRSTDGGTTWSRSNFLFTHDSEHGLTIDPVTPGTLYLSAYGSGVYRSIDDGITWLNPDSASKKLGNLFVRDLVAVAGQSGHLFVGAGNGVWESLDGATTWNQTSNGLPASFGVHSLALVPGTPPSLYAGSDSAGVWRSPDGGASWASASSGIPVPFIHTLLADATNALTVFAGTDSGLYRTTNGGASWVPLRGGLPYGANASLRAIVQDPLSPQVMFAALFGGGVYESLDHGITWAPVFAQSGLANLNVRSLAVDGSRKTIYAGTDNGVWSAGGYVTPVAVGSGPRPLALTLGAWPNPSRGTAVKLEFIMPQAGRAELAVFDLTGARVRTLARLVAATAGTHRLVWDLRQDDGGPIASGLYFVRLLTPWGERTQRVSLAGR